MILKRLYSKNCFFSCSKTVILLKHLKDACCCWHLLIMPISLTCKFSQRFTMIPKVSAFRRWWSLAFRCPRKFALFPITPQPNWTATHPFLVTFFGLKLPYKSCQNTLLLSTNRISVHLTWQNKWEYHWSEIHQWQWH